MYSKISETINSLDTSSIPEERKQILIEFAKLVVRYKKYKRQVKLNFICTHNSRRSHLAQVWAQTLAQYFGLKVESYSGGTEATAVYPMVIKTLKKQGFEIEQLNAPPSGNAIYLLSFAERREPEKLWSKEYNHYFNPLEKFVAVMTCSDADENCPVISGAKHRFALNYDDPKVFDDTEYAEEKYLERSTQIATELFFVFQYIKNLK